MLQGDRFMSTIPEARLQFLLQTTTATLNEYRSHQATIKRYQVDEVTIQTEMFVFVIR